MKNSDVIYCTYDRTPLMPSIALLTKSQRDRREEMGLHEFR